MNATAVLRRVAVPSVVGTALLLTGAGAAFALYDARLAASGTGTATSSATETVTMTVSGTLSTGLYPGGPGADVTMAVRNPYSRPLKITAVAATGNVTVTPLAGRTCATTGLTVATPSDLPVTVPVGTGTTSVPFDGLVRMGLTAENGCQGASFQMTFVVMGQV